MWHNQVLPNMQKEVSLLKSNAVENQAKVKNEADEPFEHENSLEENIIELAQTIQTVVDRGEPLKRSKGIEFSVLRSKPTWLD